MAAWQIPLSVGSKVPLTTPAQAQQQGLTLQQLAGQVAIQKQIQQENALKVQAQQEDQDDQSTIQQAFHDIGSTGDTGASEDDIFKKVRAAVAPKIRLRNLQALDADHLNVLRGLSQMEGEKRQKVINRNTAVGNELLGLLQTPQDQRPSAYQAARTRLIQSGDITPEEYPETIPLDDQTLKAELAKHNYAGQVAKLADTQAQEEQRKQAAKRAEEQAKLDKTKEQTLQKQRAREEAASRYQSIATPEQHEAWKAWLQKEHPDVAGEYANLEFDPETTPDTVENMALSAQQRATNTYRSRMADVAEEKAKLYGGRAGLIARAHDPTLKPEEREAWQKAVEDYDKTAGPATANAKLLQQRYEQRRADADSKEHTKLQQQEADQWAIRGRYGDVLKQAGIQEGETDPGKLAATVKDPRNGKDITAAEALRLMSTAKDKATTLQKEASELRKRHGWGEFGQKQPAPAATPAINPTATNPPAVKPPANAAPPASMLKEGVATKFKNGQIWTLKNGKPTQLQSQGQ